MISPGRGLSPGEDGGEGRAAPQPLPRALWEGRVGQEPPQRHSGPCAQGAAPARCQHSGGDKPQVRDTGDCTWGRQEPPSPGEQRHPQGAGRPLGAQRMGHSSTRGSDAGEMMAGSKAAPSSCTRSQTRGPETPPYLPLPEPAQVQREGRVAARETLKSGPAAPRV